jgi:hypothetical protein
MLFMYEGEMVLNTISYYFLEENFMFQKFKITSCAFILCLFGFVGLMFVSQPANAAEGDACGKGKLRGAM